MKQGEIINNPEVQRIVDENNGKTVHIHVHQTPVDPPKPQKPKTSCCAWFALLVILGVFVPIFWGVITSGSRPPTPPKPPSADEIRRKNLANAKIEVFQNTGFLSRIEGYNYYVNGNMWDILSKDEKYNVVTFCAFHKSQGKDPASCNVISTAGRKLAEYGVWGGVKLID